MFLYDLINHYINKYNLLFSYIFIVLLLLIFIGHNSKSSAIVSSQAEYLSQFMNGYVFCVLYDF